MPNTRRSRSAHGKRCRRLRRRPPRCGHPQTGAARVAVAEAGRSNASNAPPRVPHCTRGAFLTLPLLSARRAMQCPSRCAEALARGRFAKRVENDALRARYRAPSGRP
jgi:hypothetical protein